VVKHFGTDTVYCDATGRRGNQDPYVWNAHFLHTYCHMTELSPKPAVGDYIFWVYGDTFPDFSALYCDLVFVVESKCSWEHPNRIDAHDPIVDSPEAFTDHYLWGCGYEHVFQKPGKKRFTLKADPSHSFQPQDADGNLLNIVEILASYQYPLTTLHHTVVKTRFPPRSRPLCLDSNVTYALYEWLQHAPIRLTGDTLEQIRKAHPQLASKPPAHAPKCQ
jgi:hypothetical protein